MNALSSRTNQITELSHEFPQSGRKRIALTAFIYFCVFYSLFALYVAGKVSALVFGFVGIFVFIRYFDLTHEEMHTRQNDHRIWKILRWVFSISGPLQLGYLALAKNHRLHHAHQGTDKDPDLWIEEGTFLKSFFHCMTQPEQAVIRYYKDFGFEWRFVLDTTAYLAIWGSSSGNLHAFSISSLQSCGQNREWSELVGIRAHSASAGNLCRF